MTEYAPFSAIAGGALIGLSAGLLLWLNGRVAGISGIVYGVFTREASERNWRLLFIIGLVVGGALYQAMTDSTLITRSDFSLLHLTSAGLLVGIGTRLGSGCTSGHGVCGISRMSSRSIFSTLTFMIAGIATASLMRILVGVAT